MIKQHHFPNVAAVTTLFVVLLGSGTSLAHAKGASHNKVHESSPIRHTRSVEQRNIRVTDKSGKLSKHKQKHKIPVVKNYKAVGTASWYGYESGNITATGVRFNPRAMTAAHRTLPLNSKVQVTNLANHRSVVVTINDRGPYAKGRLIDLSLASAKALDIKSKGTGRVEVKSIN